MCVCVVWVCVCANLVQVWMEYVSILYQKNVTHTHTHTHTNAYAYIHIQWNIFFKRLVLMNIVDDELLLKEKTSPKAKSCQVPLSIVISAHTNCSNVFFSLSPHGGANTPQRFSLGRADTLTPTPLG